MRRRLGPEALSCATSVAFSATQLVAGAGAHVLAPLAVACADARCCACPAWSALATPASPAGLGAASLMGPSSPGSGSSLSSAPLLTMRCDMSSSTSLPAEGPARPDAAAPRAPPRPRPTGGTPAGSTHPDMEGLLFQRSTFVKMLLVSAPRSQTDTLDTRSQSRKSFSVTKTPARKSLGPAMVWRRRGVSRPCTSACARGSTHSQPWARAALKLAAMARDLAARSTAALRNLKEPAAPMSGTLSTCIFW
mmetsp:Transcript_17071/g.52721  ORF Transcript_17071/g.52721 Transcript_17071/m.52721 type:complete len:250 (-) Transcript_17071:1115-1864(-)